MTFDEVVRDPEFLSLPSGERLKVMRKVGAVDKEFSALPQGEQEKVFQFFTQGQQPSQGLGQYGLGLLESVPQTAIGLGREAIQFGRDITSIPSRLAQAGQIDWGDVARHPSQLVSAAGETGRQLVAPLVQAIPEISGATIGTLLGGPGGAPIGAATMRELVGVLEGVPARERGQAAGAAALSTAAGQRLPQAVEFVRKAPGRYASLPAERHAAGAEIMEKIPERFGVDDALVKSRYNQAERISTAQAKQGIGAKSDLANFRSQTNQLANDLAANPIPELQDTSFIARLQKMNSQANDLVSKTGGTSAQGMDFIIKAVNKEIGKTAGAERGLWKDVLHSLHDDVRAVSQATGDPAFRAYTDAIHTARLNFLRSDIQEVVNTSGIRTQRTGRSVITSPGAIQQWMRKNPEWVKAVEKANPGILESIRADLQEITPITDIAGRSIPGQQYGSGRFALGAGMGVILSRLLKLDPLTTSAALSLLSGVSGKVGLELGPKYIRRSFQPVRGPSRVGAGIGATMAPSVGTAQSE